MVLVDTGSFVFTGTFNSLSCLARFRSPSCFSFHKLLELGTNNLGPAGLELFPRECRKFRESFQANVSQFQPRFVAIGQQFEGDQGIALVLIIHPVVGDFLLWNHLGELATMGTRQTLMLSGNVNLKTYFAIEYRQVE